MFGLRIGVVILLVLLMTALLSSFYVWEYNTVLQERQVEEAGLNHLERLMLQLGHNLKRCFELDQVTEARAEILSLRTYQQIDFVVLADEKSRIIYSTDYQLLGRRLEDITEDKKTFLKHLEEIRKSKSPVAYFNAKRSKVLGILPGLFPVEEYELRLKDQGIILMQYDLARPKKVARHNIENQIKQHAVFFLMFSVLLWAFMDFFIIRRLNKLLGLSLHAVGIDALPKNETREKDELALLEKLFGRMYERVVSARGEHEKTKTLLAHSQEKLGAIIESSLIGVYQSEDNGQLLFVNQAFLKIFEYDVMADINVCGGMLSLYADYRDWAKLVLSAAEKGSIDNYEVEYRTKSGKKRHILLNIRSNNNILSGTMIDITEIKQTKGELLKIKQRLDAHLANSPVAVVEFDSEFRVVRWSGGAERIFGWKQEEVNGKTINEINWFCEEDAKPLRQVLEELISGRSTRSKSLNRNYRKNGTVIFCEWYNSALYDEIGGLNSIFSLILDITEHRRMEEELRHNERRLSYAQDISRLGFWDWNIISGEIYWSDWCYRHFGYNPQEFKPTYKKLREIIHPDDLAHVNSCVDMALEKGGKYAVDFRFFRADGAMGYLHSRGEITRDANNKPIRFMGIQIDITEQKKLEESLRSSLQEKEVLSRELNHRVNNSLQLISTMLKQQVKQIADKQDAVDAINKSLDRIQTIAFIHARLYKEADFFSISIDEYINELANHLYAAYVADRKRIKMQIKTSNIVLSIDRAVTFGLILNELITNSLKHSFPADREGTVEISLRELNERSIELIVKDNGVGMPEGFELKNTKTSGLHMVQMMVEKQLAGAIKLDAREGVKWIVIFDRTCSGGQ